MEVFNRTRGGLVASRVIRADNPRTRAKGLLGRESMEAGEAMWIVPCAMIHTFFMRFAIDVVFLDRDMRVAKVLEKLRPWRVSPWVFRARSVLELAGGSLKGAVAPGDQLEVK